MNQLLCHVATIGFLILPGLIPMQPAHGQSQLVKTTVTYHRIDGHSVLVDVRRLAGDRVSPVIVWIHGGTLIMEHWESIHREARDCRKERLCTGFV